MALHVDPSNEAAAGLYDGLGYRDGAAEPEWDQYLLEQRQLMLKVKRVPASVRDPEALWTEEHRWLNAAVQPPPDLPVLFRDSPRAPPGGDAAGGARGGVGGGAGR